MNRNIIYYSESGEIQHDDLPWDFDFGSAGILVLRSRTRDELLRYCKAYLPILITIHLDRGPEDQGRLIGDIRSCFGDHGWKPPVLGYLSSRSTPGEYPSHALSGFDNLLTVDDPQRFRIW